MEVRGTPLRPPPQGQWDRQNSISAGENNFNRKHGGKQQANLFCVPS